MKASITGGTDAQQEMCLDFMHYATLSLCGPRLYRVLEIDLCIEENMDHLGSAGAYYDTRYPRAFDIDLNQRLLPRPQLQVLAHELVHVKQYARGELRALVQGGYSWNGKKYKHITAEREVWSKEYNRLPWEIEARGMEEVLFLEWCEDRGVTDEWSKLDLYTH